MDAHEAPVIAQSALKHGETEHDILHALRQPVYVHAVDDEGLTMVIGPARDSRLLEVVIAMSEDGTIVAIHAMTARSKNVRRW